MFEAQLGALRDIDFGIFPYTSSSSSNAGYACVGAGIPGSHVDRTVGIVKAYSTCVGEGPFTAEWFGDEAEQLRVAGGEYGASTGRPAQSWSHRSGCHALWLPYSGRDRGCAHEAGCAVLYEGDSRLHAV